MASNDRPLDPRRLSRDRNNDNDPRKRRSSQSPENDSSPRRKVPKVSQLEESSIPHSSLVQNDAMRFTPNDTLQSDPHGSCAKVASFQTAMDQATAQLERAKADHETSQHQRFQAFAAIKDQQSRNYAKAVDKHKLLEQRLADQRRLQEDTASKLAAHLSQAVHVGPNPSLPGEMSRDVSQLRSELGDLKVELRNKIKHEIETLRVQNDLTATTRVLDERKLADELSTRIELHENRIQIVTTQIAQLANSFRASLNEVETRIKHSRDSEALPGPVIEERLQKLESEVKAIEDGNDEKDAMVAEELDKSSVRIGKLEQERHLTALQNSRPSNEELSSIRASIDTSLDELRAKVEQTSERVVSLQAAHHKMETQARSQTLAPAMRHFTPALPLSAADDPAGRVNGVSGTPSSVPGPSLDHLAQEIEQLKAAGRSAKFRLDNLTTDEVVRKMLDQLSQLYPDVKVAQQWHNMLQKCRQDLFICGKNVENLTKAWTATEHKILPLQEKVSTIETGVEKNQEKLLETVNNIVEKTSQVEADGKEVLQKVNGELLKHSTELIRLGGAVKDLAEMTNRPR